MLLSCVGNIFSMGDDTSKIYVSTADSAYSKAAALLASASCTVGGFKLLELPASQNALATAASILESSKAGSYAIQGLGGMFVESIVGSFSGVVGLPLFETAQLLSKQGIEFFK